jgi:hypothetical protein
MMDINPASNRSYKIKRNIWIDDEMFYSKAFIALSASTLRTLMRCLQKRRWEKKRSKVIVKNEDFIFPYAEAKFLGIGTTQFWKNMKQLVEMGFIDVVYQGGWYQKHEREKDYSVYRLSDRWRQYGTQAFEPIEKAKVLQRDFYIRSNMERKKSKATSQKRSRQLHDNEVETLKLDDSRLHDSEVGLKPERMRKRPANAV